MMKRKDFVHTYITNKAMGFLGANIITAKDDSWSRQRRIVAPALNERISQDVWTESTEQASSLADTLHLPSTTHSLEKSSEAVTGVRTIAMNVLARIAYGYNKPFAASQSSDLQAANFSYVDAIELCTQFLALAAFIPGGLLRLPIMPRLLQTIGAAMKQLPELTRDMLDQERSKGSSTPSSGRSTIMSTLVRLSDQGKDQVSSGNSLLVEKNQQTTEASTSGSSYLTEEEIAGNLFIFTAAGFDTTANTMSYAITLLAACPEWQAWIQAEIDTVFGDTLGGVDGESALPEYATAFPKLKRCLAVMLETLRLYPPVTLLTRSTTTPQTIQLENSSTSFHLPAPISVYINTVALHTSTSIWGPDALEFNPSRWLRPVSGEGAELEIMTPPRCTYLPWSVGPRICPGQKMAQVEFVAVIATLFRKCTAQPIVKKGESMQQAKQRLLDLTQDSQAGLTLQMNRPKEVSLKWTKR
ncbi:CypX Cytochrome P450 [Pyrenophora tritici-repentis]|nr:CypX Cytochrome P450 [Pyrenophora tritici-repentis]KAG9383028.1 CypX Cytochrome P450 [Pyrenophora tritici-repentis]KAI1590125.1 CypX Cytochrome P450 [Pyrenophora tritici-repentis]PZC94412.1 CypX, Cytochrome P450 [Pyrenophora tritici-repentis]PZD28003.1 CypX, Cytochrome P450 [Pyrenophora tritici-repentis]